ncbi:MAG TPA: hypothetical protein DEU95_03750, partial [Chloroflexi bacterium]|nr:hypothetical protein [Chloroflexota bacterium]HCG28859.1 hypothetical protein [Chloroflexota bacterium]
MTAATIEIIFQRESRASSNGELASCVVEEIDSNVGCLLLVRLLSGYVAQRARRAMFCRPAMFQSLDRAGHNLERIDDHSQLRVGQNLDELIEARMTDAMQALDLALAGRCQPADDDTPIG